MRAQLANTPAEVVVANHCYGLFELAAIYLSQTPPMLFQARLAIDGLGFLLEGLRGRLGEAEPSLLESLSQLRLAFVRLESAEQSGTDTAASFSEGPGQGSSRPIGLGPAGPFGRRGQALDGPADEPAQLAPVDPRRCRGPWPGSVERQLMDVPPWRWASSVTTAL